MCYYSSATIGMGRRIHESTVQSVFDLDIVEVIKDYVKLKKAGVNYKGLSPFSNEKTPSFIVSPAKGIYKDFSSGKGGSAVKFVMEHESLTFPTAIERIARDHGIAVKWKQGSPAQEARYRLYDLLEDATKHYEHLLGRYPAVLDYLHDRGFKDETLTAFRIGYAPAKGTTTLKRVLETKGYTLEEMVKAGVVKQKEEENGKKHSFDFFWDNRIIFPIINRSGQPVSMAGRYCTPEGFSDEKKVGKPKYVNGPTTPIFNKSATLYGTGTPMINKLVQQQGRIAVPEGPTDVMMLQQADIPALAKMGSHFTNMQISIMQRYGARTIEFLDDGDIAGLKGVKADTSLLAQQGLWPSIIQLPTGSDPAKHFRSLEDPKQAYDEMERLTPTVFYVRVAKALTEEELGPEKAKETWKSTMNRLFVAQDLMREYHTWKGGDGIIMAELTELEKELELPAQTLVALHFESYQEAHKERGDDLPHKKLPERVINDYFASLLITPKDYAEHLFNDIPVDHPIFNRQQQELYAVIKQEKEEGKYRFKPTFSKDHRGNKVATLKEKTRDVIKRGNAYSYEYIKVYEEDEELFPMDRTSVTLFLADAYEEGRLSTIPAGFLKRTHKYFPADVDFSAGSVQAYMESHEEKRLFNELFTANRYGDKQRAEAIMERLDLLRR